MPSVPGLRSCYEKAGRLVYFGRMLDKIRLHAAGKLPADYFMMKRGWRDEATALLRERIVEYGLSGKPIETFFDLNDYDEGRDPVAARAWSRV